MKLHPRTMEIAMPNYWTKKLRFLIHQSQWPCPPSCLRYNYSMTPSIETKALMGPAKASLRVSAWQAQQMPFHQPPRRRNTGACHMHGREVKWSSWLQDVNRRTSEPKSATDACTTDSNYLIMRHIERWPQDNNMLHATSTERQRSVQFKLRLRSWTACMETEIEKLNSLYGPCSLHQKAKTEVNPYLEFRFTCSKYTRFIPAWIWIRFRNAKHGGQRTNRIQTKNSNARRIFDYKDQNLQGCEESILFRVSKQREIIQPWLLPLLGCCS